LHLSRLKLTDYRNFDRTTVELPVEGIAISGQNGRGKSNLLEAIFFLAIAKSARGAQDRDVVRWGAQSFVVEGSIIRQDVPIELRVAFDSQQQKKKAFVDGEPLPRVSGIVGQFNAVLFSPEDVDLVLRTPAERRRLLDILISQSNPSHLSDLETYRRVLAQRNRLLKDEGHRLRVDSSQLDAWDSQLAEAGARIVSDRLATLSFIEARACSFYQRISSEAQALSLAYRGAVASSAADARFSDLLDALRSRREDEIRLGHTLSGPHRDHLVFQLDGRPVHKFGSKGQMKSALLSWKLAEAVYLEAHTGHQPVLLMDDVFSELDASRASSVLELVDDFGQVVLTTARDPDLDIREGRYGVVDL
tara:strand:+ start:6110 stop:7195 length:1086 start_codon:yes stop_codon:yes gene_type:complete